MNNAAASKTDLAKHWLAEIAAYDARQKRARWHMWSRHSVSRYLLMNGEGITAQTPDEDGREARYNIFWSNVENLKPGMYAKTPKPIVSRRHNDDNPIARTGAEVIERVLAYQLSEHGFGSAIRAARDDYLLVGRGTPWVRYVPHIVTIPDEPSDTQALAADDSDAASPPREMLAFEEAVVDYVHWSDFGHTDARRWEDVRACWRRVRGDKDHITKELGPEWAVKLAYDAATIRSDSGQENSDARVDGQPGLDAKATYYEVWDALNRQTVFVAKGQTEPLKVIDDDPLGLPRFFPCSRPIYATLANEDLFPVSDYRQYRTQIRQIQNLTRRIDALTDAVRLVGAYDSTVPELKDIFKQADNTLVAVTNWAALAGKGGLDGTITLVPMKEIAETLSILHDERDKALNDSYQLTGISDLIRGDTQASETATAQNIKNNYITMRFDEKKREVDRCVVNTLDIIASIICRQFADKTIVQMSGMQLFATRADKQACVAAQQSAGQPPQPGQPPMPQPTPQQADMCDKPAWEEVLAFIRDEPERSFLIDIETDSTVAADQQAQKQGAVEFLTAVGGFLKAATDAAQTQPALVPLMGKMLEWGVRQFPIGRDLEDAVSSAVVKLEEAAKAAQNAPPQPDPQMAKVQGELQIKQQAAQASAALDQQKLAADVTLKSKAMGHDHAHDAMGVRADAMADHRDTLNDHGAEAMKAQIASALAQQAEQAKAQMAEMQAHYAQATAVLVAHIQNLGKIEVARITADASADADAEADEKAQGA